MKKQFVTMAIVGFLFAGNAWSDPQYSNAPTSLHIDMVTNGVGQTEGFFPFTFMEPGVFDIGLDLGANGTIDLWFSEDRSHFLGRHNFNEIIPDNWRRYIWRLDEYAGQTVKLVIVDRSEQYYMAINAIRLNNADGRIVANHVPNGYFEDETPLAGWTITEGSITDPASLIIRDVDMVHTDYSSAFLSTRTDPWDTDNSETVVIESDPFVLEAPTSFIYTRISGGASEMFNKPGASGSDNGSGVYLHVGTETEDPSGEFDPERDIPVYGFWAGSAASVNNAFWAYIINTSGLEGRRAQIVGVDNSEIFHIGMDSFRMNWDNDIIRNGDFSEGIPTPEDDPGAVIWFDEGSGFGIEYTQHPSGSIPGWSVNIDPDGIATAWFFDKAAHGDQFTGRTYIGTAGDANGRFETGVEIRSDVFTIEPIPAESESVFLQFSGAQATSRIRYNADGSQMAHGVVKLIVDVNGNGEFGDEGDYEYVQLNQGMGHNRNTSDQDLWQYPDYRFYIKPEHQGLNAQIYVEETFSAFRAAWGWMAVDNFYVWDGVETRLAFPNSDFEEGTLDNWNEEVSIAGGSDNWSWLAGSFDAFMDGLVEHPALNNRQSMIGDSQFNASSAPQPVAGGDNSTGRLWSDPFPLPVLGSPVLDWEVME